MAAARRRSFVSSPDENDVALRRDSTPEPPESLRDDLVDVPAAIVCALCGDADCMGCAEERSKSGFISIVPWERPGGTLARLWSTSKAATLNAEAFFESLPDGPIGPALRFALLAEVVASSSMLVLVGGLLSVTLALLSGWSAFDPAIVGFAIRAALAGVVGLSVLLVAAHASHGLALGMGARRRGARTGLGRALRFGLYSAGWDLVLGPVGFVGLLREKTSMMGLAIGLPTRASIAFLRGTYRLEGVDAKPALHASYVAAVVATLTCALAMLVAIAAVLFH